MNKYKTLDNVLDLIEEGMTLMVGGFMGVGTPERLIDGLVAKGVKNLTIIANDTAFIDKGLGKLIANKQVRKVIASHIGTNKETGRQMNEGSLEVVLIPQGTLAEQIRAAGAGLGGVLTPIGLGTVVEKDKTVIEIDGTPYLLEKPLFADVALLHGSKVDSVGNTFHYATTRNFNPLMAMAAKVVIVEAETLVAKGELDPHEVMTPGIFVNYVTGGKV